MSPDTGRRRDGESMPQGWGLRQPFFLQPKLMASVGQVSRQSPQPKQSGITLFPATIAGMAWQSVFSTQAPQLLQA